MKKHLPLGITAVAGILIIVLLASMLINPSSTGEVVQKRTTLSERLCPPGTVSVYRGSPPLYPGGPAEQLNVVCVSAYEPIPAEGKYFEHRYVYPFDRFKQDQLTRLYD